MQIPTVGSKRFFSYVFDGFSRFTIILLLKSELKSEVLAKFKDYASMTANKSSRKICAIRSDNGGEYSGK